MTGLMIPSNVFKAPFGNGSTKTAFDGPKLSIGHGFSKDIDVMLKW